MKELHTSSNAIGALMVTIFLMGYAIGPLFLSPMSEIYGRYPVIVISCWAFIAFLVGCGFAPSMPSLIVMRFLAGTGGSAVMSIAPAIVAVCNAPSSVPFRNFRHTNSQIRTFIPLSGDHSQWELFLYADLISRHKTPLTS
jgi:MFS family permease